MPLNARDSIRSAIGSRVEHYEALRESFRKQFGEMRDEAREAEAEVVSAVTEAGVAVSAVGESLFGKFGRLYGHPLSAFCFHGESLQVMTALLLVVPEFDPGRPDAMAMTYQMELRNVTVEGGKVVDFEDASVVNFCSGASGKVQNALDYVIDCAADRIAARREREGAAS